MNTPSYNEVAGRSVERVAALSDGVFAFALTLLVIELRVPVVASVHSDAGLWRALASLGPDFLTYLLSFLTLGVVWLDQHTQLSNIKHSDRSFAWIHLGLLLMVTMVPFSTKLLSAFITYRSALLIYWINIVGIGAMRYASWEYAHKANLFKEETHPGTFEAVRRRILHAQVLYAVATLFCFVDNYLSIALLVVVQLCYVLGPSVGLLRWF